MPPSWQALSLLLALPAIISAVTFDCDGETVKGQTFVFKQLGGPKQVNWQQANDLDIHNTTFTIDLCNPIKQVSSVDPKEQCPDGTRVCAVERLYQKESVILDKVIPIAGEYTYSEGMHLDPTMERLQDSSSHEDEGKEGLRVILNGGRYPFKDTNGSTQKAIIEFICNKDLTGNEGFEGETDALSRRAETEDGDDDIPKMPDLDAGKSLQFVSYKQRDDGDILRLTWQTKYACADTVDDKEPGSTSAGWGFFTWFVIVVFLLAAAYIIFGSWLNYNRYGARGWDLVPHGDTIRDLPYILKELGSNLMSRIRGEGGSRGGYSAV